MSLRQKLRNHAPYTLFIVVLLSCSAFFTYKVEDFRGRVSKARLDRVVESGARVHVVDIIDGDELAVQTAEDNPFVVRMLGIRSFDPIAIDPGVGLVGQQAQRFLEERLQGQDVIIEFDEFKKDKRGRLLAYVRADDRDLGEVMIARGLTLVYTLFPFSRSARYLEVQSDAEQEHRGMWGIPRARARARALLDSWAVEPRR